MLPTAIWIFNCWQVVSFVIFCVVAELLDS